MKPISRCAPLLLSLALAWAGPAPAAEPQPASPAKAPCAKEDFRGKGAKARRQACLDELKRQAQADREQEEALRRDLAERCAQDPRRCEAHTAELNEKLQGWRDRQGEGQAAH